MKTSILIRFDDICPTMDFEQFNKAMDLLDRFNIKPLIGVIPDCKDPDLFIDEERINFWEWVKCLQKKGYTIAMHGYQHVFTTKKRGIITRRAVSEFSGHSLEEQIEKIKRGYDILLSHGIQTDVFFAPAHSYDENTLRALQKVGFKYISDGKSIKPYIWHGIKCLPARSNGCPSITRSGIYTAVFHAHEWKREDKKYDLDSFENIILQHHRDIVSFTTFKELPCGTFILERLVEIIYVFIERHFLNTAVAIKHFLKL